MKIRWGRSILAAALAELGTYIAWAVVLIVAGLIFMNPSRTQWFAYFFGQAVGIFSGFILCIFAGRWVARVSDDATKSGFVVGALCAALNVLVVLTQVGMFPPILAAGSLGRLLGGGVGGWLVHRRKKPNKPIHATREDARA